MQKKHLLLLAGTIFVSAPIFAESAQPASREGSSPAIIMPDDQNPDAPVRGKNSFTEDQARDRIGEAGYTNITNLRLDDNGIWRGTATRNGEQVNVAFDYQGNVVANDSRTNTTVSNAMTEREIRDRISTEGYTDISGLTKNSNGNWHAVATKNGERMNVVFDTNGRLMTAEKRDNNTRNVNLTENQAKERITEAGYSNVSNTTRDSNGMWRATATRNGQRVNVIFDANGNVVER